MSQITDMQMKIESIRKQKTHTYETQTSEKGQTQRAIRTLEYRLERVSCKMCNQILVVGIDMPCNCVVLYSVTSIT